MTPVIEKRKGYRVLYDFVAQDAAEITLRQDEFVTIITKGIGRGKKILSYPECRN
jgi:hypothetical protein